MLSNGSQANAQQNLSSLPNVTFTSELTTVAGAETEEPLIEDKVSEWLWKIIPPFLFVFGLTGNFLTIGVIRRLGLRNQPTLVFICFLAFTDSIVLLTGLPRYWMLYTFDIDIRSLTTVHCKLYYFFIYTSMQYSSWILVGITIERLFKTHFAMQYRIIYTVRKVSIGLIVTLILLIGVNFHFFFTNGVSDFTEGSCDSLTPEYYYFDNYIFVYVDFSILSAVPFVIMFISNIFLVRALHRFSVRRVSMMHRSTLRQANRVSVRMTKMCIICTFYFLFATTPISIYFIMDTYLYSKYEEEGNRSAVAQMDLGWSITYIIQFSNYCINFLVYTLANSRFMSELKLLLHCKPSTRRIRIYTTRTPNGSQRNCGEEMTSSGRSSHGFESTGSMENPL